MRIFSASIAVVLVPMAPGAFAQELMLINPLDADRPQEVIEVPTVSCIALAPARMPLP